MSIDLNQDTESIVEQFMTYIEDVLPAYVGIAVINRVIETYHDSIEGDEDLEII